LVAMIWGLSCLGNRATPGGLPLLHSPRAPLPQSVCCRAPVRYPPRRNYRSAPRPSLHLKCYCMPATLFLHLFTEHGRECAPAGNRCSSEENGDAFCTVIVSACSSPVGNHLHFFCTTTKIFELRFSSRSIVTCIGYVRFGRYLTCFSTTAMRRFCKKNVHFAKLCESTVYLPFRKIEENATFRRFSVFLVVRR